MAVTAALDLKIGSKDAVTAASRLKRMGVAAREAGTRLRDANGRFIGHEKGVRSLVGAYDKLGVKISGVVAGFAAFALVKKAISVIAEFGETMATVGAVLGLLGDQTEKSASQFADLEAQARKLGATTRFSAKQAAEGQLALARSGFTVAEVQLATADALNLAAAASLSLGRAAEITAITIRQFGLSALEATRVTDVLVTTANNSATTVEQLAQGLKFAGTIAHGFGKSLEETTAALGVLSNAGLQATQAGTAFRGIMAALAKPSSEAAGTIANLAKISGQLSSDFDITTRSTEEVFQSFKKANAGPKEMLAIFGRLQAPGALALTAGADSARELEEANLAVTTSAKEMADIINDTLKGDILALKAAFEELFLSANDGVGPALRSMVQVMTEAIQILAGMEAGAQGYSAAARILVFVTKAVIASFVAFAALKAAAGIITMVRAVQGLTLSMKALRVAVASTGIGLLAVVLGVATAAALEFFGVFEDGSENLEKDTAAALAAAKKASSDALAEQAKVQAGVRARLSEQIKAVEALDDKNKETEKKAKAAAKDAERRWKAEKRARESAGASIAAENRAIGRRIELAQFEAGQARKLEAELLKIADRRARELGFKKGELIPPEAFAEIKTYAEAFRAPIEAAREAERVTAIGFAANANIEDLEKTVDATRLAVENFGRSASSAIRVETFDEYRDAFKEVVDNANIATEALIADGDSIEEAWRQSSGGIDTFKEKLRELAQLRILQALIPEVNAARDAFLELAQSTNFTVEGVTQLETAAATAIGKYSEAIANGAANSAELEQAIRDINSEVDLFKENTEEAAALAMFESLTISATNSFIDFARSIVSGSESAADALEKLVGAILEAAIQEFVIKQLISTISSGFNLAGNSLPNVTASPGGVGAGFDSLPSPTAAPSIAPLAFRSGSIATGAPPPSTRSSDGRANVGGGSVVNLTQNIQTPDANSFGLSQRQIASRASEGLQVSRRRTRRPAA